MTGSRTTLELAESWCFGETVPRPVAPLDETFTIVEAQSREAEIDVAARCYEQAARRGAGRVVFAVRDRRAPRAELVTGLRERNVPVGQLPGVAPRDDPVVDELLDVTLALGQLETGDLEDDVRLGLANRVGRGVDVETVLNMAAETGSLGEALHTWVAETNLVDRLLTSDGVHHRGSPRGTVDQRSSAVNLGTVLETAAFLDTAAAATTTSPSFGPEELVAAIKESIVEPEQKLFATGERPPTSRPVAELVKMTELKLADQADVVVVLELTEELVDEDPSEQTFSVAPDLGRHPDIPGITSVSRDRAAQTFGATPHVSDGKRAWFLGLGRRYLGNTLSAASDRAVLVTRRGATKDLGTRPSRTVVELGEQLCLETQQASDFLAMNPSPADGDNGDSDGDLAVDGLLDNLRDQLGATEDGEDSETGDDATLRDVVEQLDDAHRAGVLSPDQQRELLAILAQRRET